MAGFLFIFGELGNGQVNYYMKEDSKGGKNRMAGNERKILVCDDSLLIRSQLADFIKGLGKDITVIEAEDGEIAVRLFSEHHPDLVFLDVVMPNGGGISCLKQIKEIDSDAKVVIVSSSGTKEVLKEALEAGATDFIQKPWSQTLISQVISKAIS